MSFKCPFCIRYFSTRSAYSQHKNFCMPSDDVSSDSEELEKLEKTNNCDDIEVRKSYDFLDFLKILNFYIKI